MKALTPQQVARLQNMLIAAQQAKNSGLIDQAEYLYRDILKAAPAAYDVEHQLAILLATTGRPKEAAAHFRSILKANPTHAPTHANLGNALADSGELDEAIREYRRAIALDSTLVWAFVALGAALRRAENPEEAILHYRRALDLDKVNHAAFNGLGLAYRDIGDLPRALECFDHAVGLAPQSADYHLNFGVTLRRHQLLNLAAEELYEAVKLRPMWLEAVILLADVLQEQRRFDEAKECIDRALELEAGEPELYERLGYLYLEMGDTDHALKEFKGLLDKYPDRHMAMLGLGRGYLDAGYSDDAAAILQTVMQQFPEDKSVYFYLAGSRKFGSEDPIIPRLQQLAKNVDEKDPAAIDLNFALGKILDDCKQWDAAFRYYAEGNRLRNLEYDYQAAEDEARFEALITVFNREFMETHAHCGTDSTLPVFIVGMPRSGTTLTEQIISSHPQAIGAGEVVFWGRAWDAIPYTLNTDEPYPECMGALSSEQAHEIVQKYEGVLRKIAGPDTHPIHIIDKMPHNFIQLGLIALLFPKAPIIHCRRDAMDNCLSIFFQNFGGAHPYAYDLANIGHHFKLYERLMGHWHKLLPGRILDINYEDTIADPEYWSRKLIEHVGLDWDDACLAPHKQERTVKTASHWQVRQPIYKTSVQRWKNYEEYLGPLKTALNIQ